MGYLVHNVLHFHRLLHSMGLDVHAGRMVDVVTALDFIDIGNRSDFYFTLQTLLIRRPQDLARFDEAFRTFWRPPPGAWSSQNLRAMAEQRRFGPPHVDAAVGDSSAQDQSVTTLDETVERTAPLSYSGREVSRVQDFARFTEEELQRARKVIAAMTWISDGGKPGAGLPAPTAFPISGKWCGTTSDTAASPWSCHVAIEP